ncbi:MAG TPA: SufD family Fe-S cluster assembly protein, partial [Candidatus Limnocylindrales bacterium]|nr:SufD family Fe-S cluster assembly protein [Candidatus Limnocylindrales bacterium]
SEELGEPDWLLEQRLAAARRYADLPLETNPLFTLYVDLRAAKLAEVVPYARIGRAASVEARPPKGVAALLEVREDTITAHGLSTTARDAGVVVDTFSTLARSQPDLLRELVAKAAIAEDDKAGQLARAMAAESILVHVPAGVSLAEPIVLRWAAGAGGRALLSRTVVSIGRGAHVRLLEEQVDSGAPDGAQALWAGTMELDLGDDATLDVAAEQDLPGHVVGLASRHATVGRNATLRWALGHVGALVSKSRVDNLLVGRGGTVHQVEIGFGGANQVFDLTSYTRHIGEDTTGDLLSKGVFQDRARGYIKGLIDIERSARGTDSFLGEFGMLLDRKARSVTIPSLEIDQPDVRRASHSSSVGPIDETEVFYLQTRGLADDEARKAIVLAFLEPVVARIPVPEAQERLRERLDRKWSAARSSADVPAAA